MASLCQQPDSLSRMPRPLRWFVFISGLLETALWSGNIFGWASIVHILKTNGVYSNLCAKSFQFETNETLSSSFVSHNVTHERNGIVYLLEPTEDTSPSLLHKVSEGCSAQDEQFTLVGTVAMVLYALPGILVGYALHHIGLAFTRITASLMISFGFILLSFTNKDTPDFLWGASILLSIGGNALRMAGLEFGNLFPERRNTAMAIISGIYSLSAAMFSVIQSAAESGYKWESICRFLAAASTLIIVFTPLMPKHHIPYTEKAEEIIGHEINNTGKQEGSIGQPLSRSLLSVSMVLQFIWLFSNLFAITVFGTYFNSWVNRFSKTNEEAADYSRLFGYANLFCVFITPLPGLLIDTLSTILRKGKTGIAEKVACVQAMILPMTILCVTVIIQVSCLLFFSSWAVYVGLICLIINRPSCLGIGIPFVRARFPADHFNRLLGIQGTIIALLTMIQYPLFTWTQSQYFAAMGVLVGVLSLSLVCPLHLLSKSYLLRVLSTPKSPINRETVASGI